MADHAPDVTRLREPRRRSLRPFVAMIVVVQVVWLIVLGWAVLALVT